jgi:hypothetical protein
MIIHLPFFSLLYFHGTNGETRGDAHNAGCLALMRWDTSVVYHKKDPSANLLSLRPATI